MYGKLLMSFRKYIKTMVYMKTKEVHVNLRNISKLAELVEIVKDSIFFALLQLLDINCG